MEGAFNDSGPLQAAYDECVGFGPFRLHQLTLWTHPGKTTPETRTGREMTVAIIYLYLRVSAAVHYTHSVGNRSGTPEPNRCASHGTRSDTNFTQDSMSDSTLKWPLKRDHFG